MIKLRNTDLKDLFENNSPLTTNKHYSKHLGLKLLIATKYLIIYLLRCASILLTLSMLKWERYLQWKPQIQIEV